MNAWFAVCHRKVHVAERMVTSCYPFSSACQTTCKQKQHLPYFSPGQYIHMPRARSSQFLTDRNTSHDVNPS